MSDFEEYNMGAYINALKSERDEYKRQAALYHADMMNVREQRDAALAREAELGKRVEDLEVALLVASAEVNRRRSEGPA